MIGLGSSLFFEPAYVSVSRAVASRTGARQLLSLNETWHAGGTVGAAPGAGTGAATGAGPSVTDSA